MKQRALDEKIKNRTTELQRAYDLAVMDIELCGIRIRAMTEMLSKEKAKLRAAYVLKDKCERKAYELNKSEIL